MIKFLHKKHIHKGHNYKFVIYYDFSEIILGILLLGLTAFFVYNYLQKNLFLQASSQPGFYISSAPSLNTAAKPALLKPQTTKLNK